MTNLTFILGMERFNTHIWSEVEQNLRNDRLDVRLQRFHDGHVAEQDPALEQAIAQADVLFITLINMREYAEWLGQMIERYQPKTVFAFESMPEVMGLTRVGAYRVSGGGRAAMPRPMQAILKLITRGRDEDTLYAYSKLSKLTSKLLPLMPPKLSDFRTWLSVNLYWNQPDVYNLSQMIRLILRDCCAAHLEVAPVRILPTMGCFHPAADEYFHDPQSYLKWYQRYLERRPKSDKQAAATRSGGLFHKAEQRPLVALLAFRKHVMQQQPYHAQMIEAFEREGLGVLPIFVSGIELHVAVREWVSRCHVDLLINTMGFPIVGGPAGSTKPGHYQEKAAELLGGLDVPYMIAQPLQMQNERQWHEQGVAPMQAVIMYDLPEMDGSASAVVLGAIRDQRLETVPDRLERAARQAAGWVRLRRLKPAERRVALVVYNFPPGLGKLGTAALLDVPASLQAVLQRMQSDGYQITDLPPDAETLAQRLAALDAHEQPIALNMRDYRKIVPPAQADRIDRFWGAAPGEIAPLGPQAIRLDGIEFGNVFVGVQPPMGIPGDPMRLLFDHTFTPHHQYIGFYRWLREIWKADAIVHVGMHGTAEWMPGLQLGLTGQCWPDALLGDLPHLYLYPLNNPSEAGIAKRRGYATTVSHAIPAYARAGLYKQLAQLRALLDADAADLPDLPDLPRGQAESDEVYRTRLRAYLDDLEQRLILDGLHVFGRAPEPERAAALIEAALDVPRGGQPGLSNALISAGVTAEQVPTARAEFVRSFVLSRQAPRVEAWLAQYTAGRRSTMDVQSVVEQGRAILRGLAACPNELDALMHALNGGYIPPAAGADPVRAGAAALPSGRNIHGIDPWRLPSDAALERGRMMAELLLKRHRNGNEHFPRTVALTLWALDTIKTEGESLGAALALIGARPERDGQGKIWRYQLTPLAELGRPRIDLLLDISSIFRDTFQMTLDLLDDLFRRAAAADEPEDMNPIRANALRLQAAGVPWEQATARIFTQRPGQYGTGVDALIDESAWEGDGQLADMYMQRNGYTYGGKRNGTAAPEVLRSLLGSVEHVFQAIDSVEFGLTDMQHYYGHSGAIRLAAGQGRSEAVPLSFAESHSSGVRVQSAEEQIRLEVRSKILNPKWYESMLNHGYAGAAEIGNRFTYMLGWGATTNAVDRWVYDDMATTFVLDDTMRQRLEQANPRAARNAVARLLEAHGRGLWQADELLIERLQELYADLEDRLEGVV